MVFAMYKKWKVEKTRKKGLLPSSAPTQALPFTTESVLLYTYSPYIMGTNSIT